MLVNITRSPYYTGEAALVFSHYGNGRTAIQAFDPVNREPLFTATVNVPEVSLAPDEVILKGYSENEGIPEDLVAQGIVGPATRWVNLGFVRVSVHQLRKTQ